MLGFPFGEGVAGVRQDVQDDLRVFVRIAVDPRRIFNLYDYPDLLGLEVVFDERQRLPDHLVNLEDALFLFRLEEIPEVVDRPRHVEDDPHDAVDAGGKVFLGESAAFIGEPQLLDGQPQHVQGLPPLVGDIADHLSHGGLASLMHHDAVVMTEPFFRLLAFGDVPANMNTSQKSPLLVVQGRSAHQEIAAQVIIAYLHGVLAAVLQYLVVGAIGGGLVRPVDDAVTGEPDAFFRRQPQFLRHRIVRPDDPVFEVEQGNHVGHRVKSPFPVFLGLQDRSLRYFSGVCRPNEPGEHAP